MVPVVGCHPKLLTPDLSCSWWAHGKVVPSRLFGLSNHWVISKVTKLLFMGIINSNSSSNLITFSVYLWQHSFWTCLNVCGGSNCVTNPVQGPWPRSRMQHQTASGWKAKCETNHQYVMTLDESMLNIWMRPELMFMIVVLKNMPLFSRKSTSPLFATRPPGLRDCFLSLAFT